MLNAVARLALEDRGAGETGHSGYPARRPIKPFYIRKFVEMCDDSDDTEDKASR